MRLIIICLLALVACATTKVALVEKTYSPTKGGTVKISWNAFGSESAAHSEANNVMSSFCAPQNYKTLRESENKELNSVTHSASFGTVESRANYKNRPLIQFVCY